MLREKKIQKKITKQTRKQVGIRTDKLLEGMIKDIKEKLLFESDSQVGRYAIKKLHRHIILNKKTF